MQVVEINFSASQSKGVFLMTVREQLFYAIVIQHRAGYESHMCGYLNVRKADWLRLWDVDSPFCADVTYAGIGSGLLSVPQRVLNTVPVMFGDWWVGVDWLGQAVQPSQDEVLERLHGVAIEFQDRLAALTPSIEGAE